jgi:hypothetical protein
MKALSWITFVLLAAIAALHVYWGLGGLWPAQDLRSLIDTVIGDPRLNTMPPLWATLIVAGLIFASGAFALLALAPAGRLVRFFIKSAIAVITATFLARGASGYLLPEAIRSQMSEPFATYDQLYYSPLCLMLGTAFVSLFTAKPRGQYKEPLR